MYINNKDINRIDKYRNSKYSFVDMIFISIELKGGIFGFEPLSDNTDIELWIFGDSKTVSMNMRM